MASPFQWMMELVDRVTGPAKRIESSLKHVDDQLKRVDQTGRHAQVTIISVGEALKKVATVAAEFAAVALGAEFIKAAVDAATFEQQSTIAFKTLLGSSEKAAAMLSEIKSFAFETGEPLQKVAEYYKALAFAGVERINLKYLVQAATDLEAAGRGAAQTFVETFASIQTRGRLTARALHPLLGVLNFGEVGERLGLGKGLDLKALDEALNATNISAHRGLEAILQTLATKEGGAIGTLSEQMGHTVPKMLEKLRTEWDLLLGRFAESKAFERLLGLMERLIAALDPATESGKRFERLFDNIFRMFDAGLVVLAKLFDLLEKGAPLLARFAKASGGAASLGASIGGTLAAQPPPVGFGAQGLPPKGAGQQSYEMASGMLGPMPHMAGGGITSGPTLAGESGRELVVPLTGANAGAGIGGGGPVTLEVNQHFEINADRTMDVDELAHTIARISVGDLVSALSQMGISLVGAT